MLDKSQPASGWIGQPFHEEEERELLELEARYCSYGDTVHYTEPPKIFERCEGSFIYDGRTRRSSTCRCGTRPSTSATPIRA